MKPDPIPACELCARTDFAEHVLPDGRTRSGLMVCRHCRLVFAFPPPRPAATPEPRPPDWRTYGPGAG